MEVTRSETSFHGLEFTMNMHTCIFPDTRIVEVLLRERSFSTGGNRVVFAILFDGSVPLLRHQVTSTSVVFFLHIFLHTDPDSMTTAISETV